MTIYSELKKDHRKVIKMLDKLLNTTDAAKRKELINKVADDLIPHSRAEEAILYNALRDEGIVKETIAHSYTEHLEAEALLRSLQTMEFVYVHWKAGVEKLKAALEHHIAEEEGHLFSEAEKIFSDDDAQQMAIAFNELKPQIKHGGILTSTAELIANLMPEKMRPNLRRYFTTSANDHAGPTAKAS